jgi:small conductance mechanosensitive channel
VGFDLQDVLSNFASGVMILIYRPFDVGDTIEVPDVSGKVQHMNLVSTIILTYDNQKLVVPNNKIWGNIIRNVHSEKIRRVDLTFGIGYDDDIDHAEQVLREILESHEMVLDEPKFTIKLHALNESSVDFIVRPWTLTENYWDVHWDVTRTVKERFDAEGISIPYPQRDVHVQNASSLPAL